MKIYVAAVEALRKNERQDEIQFTTKIDDGSLLNATVLFCASFVFESYPQGSGAVFFLLYGKLNSLGWV